jgi:hypothetical protein
MVETIIEEETVDNEAIREAILALNSMLTRSKIVSFVRSPSSLRYVYTTPYVTTTTTRRPYSRAGCHWTIFNIRQDLHNKLCTYRHVVQSFEMK